MKINYLQYAIFFFLIFWISGCAKIVAPTGGPKDVEPPKVLSSDPPNLSPHFEDNKIEITFDEFIQLKDLNQNLVVSPPLEEKPEVLVKGKSLVIEFPTKLKDSTTYNIYFGDAVQDYNEGNPIENFQYVLSTGEYIDSMSMEGKVLNAFNLLPQEDVLVMLYSDFSDSIPIKNIPEYIAKTDKEGFFQINNIRNDTFKIFALRDANKNYLYDLPNEEIAFSDSAVKFRMDIKPVADTIFVADFLLADPNERVVDTIWIASKKFSSDSLNPNSDDFEKDSMVVIKHKPIDTIITAMKPYYPVPVFYLMFFNEDKEAQYLVNSKRDNKRKLEIMFNKPIKDSVSVELVDTTLESKWYIQETNLTNDTIFYWLTDSSLYNKKDLKTTITYQKEDSNLVYQWTTDTINFRYFEPEKKKEEDTDTLLDIGLNVKNKSTFDLNKHIKLQFNTPIKSVDPEKIRLFAKEDTLEKEVDVKLVKDSLFFRRYAILNTYTEDSDYRLEIFPKAFTDIYGAVNDTINVAFKTQKLDYYGKILANVTGIDSSFQVIAQLVVSEKEEEKVYREKVILKDQTIDFAYLPPKEFLFKIIVDVNFNGKWDTGEYLEHIQPEEVFYYDNPINVRSNWDIEINMSVKNNK
ncbi:MAG: Ig-like domain-containing protein [Bacteroidota bacterium]|nr:Ig-like domain-containing protein [Bacteroidota bacterium]